MKLPDYGITSQVEADIRPFRGILLGLFFVTTGASIDVCSCFLQRVAHRAQR